MFHPCLSARDSVLNERPAYHGGWRWCSPIHILLFIACYVLRIQTCKNLPFLAALYYSPQQQTFWSLSEKVTTVPGRFHRLPFTLRHIARAGPGGAYISSESFLVCCRILYVDS